MAKVNDLMRLNVIDSLYSVKDVRGSVFFSPRSVGKFQIEFGEVNKKTALGRVKASASLYKTGYGVCRYSFLGVFNHISNCCEFKSIEAEREFEEGFKKIILLSINDNKISRSLHLEEEGEEGDALGEHAGACQEEAAADVDSESSTMNCAVNSSIL